MERIEDRSKDLSYIVIEVADSLKVIPAPAEEKMVEETVVEETATIEQNNAFIQETRMEVKPSLWSRIKNSKLVRTVKCIMKMRIRIDVPALPEAREQ